MDAIDAEIAALIRPAIARDEKAQREREREEEQFLLQAALIALH
jgi:hypothetical protein